MGAMTTASVLAYLHAHWAAVVAAVLVLAGLSKLADALQHWYDAQPPAWKAAHNRLGHAIYGANAGLTQLVALCRYAWRYASNSPWPLDVSATGAAPRPPAHAPPPVALARP